jgi:hypothetical protein
LFELTDDDVTAYTEWVKRVFSTYAEAAKFFEVGN